MNRITIILFLILISAKGLSQSNFSLSNFKAKSIYSNFFIGDDNNNAILVKIDANNNILFTKSYPNIEYFTEIIGINNNLYIAGVNQGKATITKVDSIGNEIWSKETQSSVNIQHCSLYNVSDTIFLHFVNSNSVNIISLDTLSNQIWSISIPTIEVHNLRCDLFKKNNFLYLAYTNAIDLTVAKLNTQGNLIWNYRYNYIGGFNPIFLNHTVLKDTTFIINGSLQSDPFIMEIDLDGNVILTKKIKDSNAPINHSEAMIEYNNEYYLLGYLDDADTIVPLYTYYLLKLDLNFNFVKQIKIGDHKNLNRFYSKLILDNNLLKMFYPFGNGNSSMTEFLFVQSMEQISCDTTNSTLNIIDYNLDTVTNSTNINSGVSLISSSYNSINSSHTITSLCPNLEITEINVGKINLFPNPTNGSFTIYSLESEIISSIGIYNLIGEKIYVSGEINNWKTSILLNEIPGIYFVIVKLDNGTKLSSKLILN